MSTPTHPSRHAITARAMFGLVGDVDPAPRPSLRDAAGALLASLRPGQIALVTGPSGSGKSSLAQALVDVARDAGVATIIAPGDPSPVGASAQLTPVDVLSGPIASRLGHLAAAGLADARLFVRPVAHLSVGERARLSIARALDNASHAPVKPAPIIVIDEFASTLDRPAAGRLARLLRRRLDSWPHARLVCLTAHDDLVASLRPDQHLHVTIGPRVEVRPTPIAPDSGQPADPGVGLVHEIGAFADYARLGEYHYRAARPAMLAGPGAIRVARSSESGQVVGVLVVAMPTLNGPWRDQAWPGVFNTPDQRENARRLSAGLRTIARVIVDPSHRGLGVATAMVRAYLSDPMTPATEALAAMGLACPFFAAGGMRPRPRPPGARDARLRDALAHLRRSPAALLDLSVLLAPDAALLSRELRVWGSRSRATRGITEPDDLAKAAAAGLLATPVAYVHADPRAWSMAHHPEVHHARRHAA